MKNIIIATTIFSCFFMPKAEATLFDFSYISSLGTIRGYIEGTLQNDNNTVVVNNIPDFLTLNNIPKHSMPHLFSFDHWKGLNQSGLPTLTLNGSYMDFIACELTCSTGSAFLFSVGTIFSSTNWPRMPFFEGNMGYWGSGVPEYFYTTNYSLIPVDNSIPVPSTLSLLVNGSAYMAWLRRKSRKG